MVFSKKWPNSRKGSLFSICFLVAVFPMFLGLLYRVLSLGAIGPWIGGLAIVNGIILPFLFYFAIVSASAGPGARLAIGFAAMVLGELFAIFGMYLFVRLAGLLGVLGPVLQ